MPEAYSEAAARHWHDAELLEGHGRICNADHLAGISAECALKAAMMLVHGFVGGDGRLHLGYRSHINALWEQLPLHNLQSRFPALVAVLKASRPFEDFDIDQRYSPSQEITQEAFARHKQWARRLLGAIPAIALGADQ